MKKITAVLTIVALFSTTLMAIPAQATAFNPLKVHLTIKNNDDVGVTNSDLKDAFKGLQEGLGNEVVDEMADGVVDFQVTVGKDDGDDDNDGTPDDKDKTPLGGDEKDKIKVLDLDKEAPEFFEGHQDKNKAEGVYFGVEIEGTTTVLESKIDSFAEESASLILTNNVMFQKASFSPSALPLKLSWKCKLAVLFIVGAWTIMMVPQLKPKNKEEAAAFGKVLATGPSHLLWCSENKDDCKKYYKPFWDVATAGLPCLKNL